MNVHEELVCGIFNFMTPANNIFKTYIDTEELLKTISIFDTTIKQ